MTKVCKKCQASFTPSKGLLSFCSLACRNSREFSEDAKLKKSSAQKDHHNNLTEEQKVLRRQKISHGLTKVVDSGGREGGGFKKKTHQIVKEQGFKCFSCQILISSEPFLKPYPYITFKDQNRKNHTSENMVGHCKVCYRKALMDARSLKSKKIHCSYEMMKENGKTLSCFDATHPNNKERRWLCLEDVVAWAKSHGINGQKEWAAYWGDKANLNSIPNKIPRDINGAYAPAFKKMGWGEVFGTGNKKCTKDSPKNGDDGVVFCSYEEAQSWAQEENIKSAIDWEVYRKTNKDTMRKDIPSNPNKSYPEWKMRGGWNGFLLNSKPNKKSFSSIELCLKKVFHDIFQSDQDTLSVKGPKGGTMPLDMVSHKYMLAIDYDGAYYHKNSLKADTYKSQAVTKLGYTIIRVRCDGLKLINPTDVHVQGKTPNVVQIKTVLDHLVDLMTEGKVFVDKSVLNRAQSIANTIDTYDFSDVVAPSWRSYDEAKKWMIENKIRGSDHWLDIRRTTPDVLPCDIPSNPHLAYPNFKQRGGWASFTGKDIQEPNKDYF